MVLKLFFDISTSFRFSKDQCECTLHSEAPPWLDWQCCLARSSKMAPRILIFSIVLGAENLSYVKSIETHAREFLTLNILYIGTVL